MLWPSIIHSYSSVNGSSGWGPSKLVAGLSLQGRWVGVGVGVGVWGCGCGCGCGVGVVYRARTDPRRAGM